MTERRWMKRVIVESRKEMPKMPWHRATKTARRADLKVLRAARSA